MKTMVALALTACISVGALEIQLPKNKSRTDHSAAVELAHYTELITGSKPEIRAESAPLNPPVIYIGETEKAKANGCTGLEREAWRVKSVSGGLILNGGGAPGALYALWHYLEDKVGVRFWNQEEEDVPKLAAMPLEGIDLSGKPAFRFRYLANLYIGDNGRFASKMRAHDGFPFVFQPKYGMNYYGLETEFGLPGFVHTFHQYISYERYFKEHHEWFTMRDGKRFGAPGFGGNGTQLCMSNKEMRKEAVKRLKEFIEKDRKDAALKGYAPPVYYDFSINDNGKKCECEECSAAVEKYGSHAGLLIECLNEMARAIRPEYPDVALHSYAYIYTEKAPKGIAPEPNVCITLCNTVGNLVVPVTDASNIFFRNMVDEWSKVSPALRVWLYGITYTKPAGLPFASEDTYAADLKFYRERKVISVFIELEQAVASDVHDYKQWLLLHLMENPDLDVDALKKDYAYGYYGAAGKAFLEYRALLRQGIDKHKAYINPFATTDLFKYMDLEMTRKCYALFDEGEKLLAQDPVRLVRWRHARLPLDRATLLRRRDLIREWIDKGNALKDFPYPPEKIAPEIEKTLAEQEKLPRNRMTEYIAKDIKAIREEKELYFAKITEKSVKLPEKFKDLPAGDYFDFTVDQAYRHKNHAVIRDVPDSECGTAVVLAWPQPEKGEVLEKYNKSLPVGVYSQMEKRNLGRGTLTWPEVKRGFNWYKVATTTLTSDCYVYFFWSWIVQLNVGRVADTMRPDQKYEVWIKVKFTGPDFPLGEKDEENAIWLERVVLKKISTETE